MKTCSSALKELFHQYRIGERRTWYIADLYTIWSNSSERIDKALVWRPYGEANVRYANAKFGLGLYDAGRSDATAGRPLIRCACPPRESFDWDNDDWTFEYFVRYPNPFLGDLGPGGIQFAVTDTMSATNPEMIPWGFAVGAPSSAYMQYFDFWIKEQTGTKGRKIVDLAGIGSSLGSFAFKHIAVSKQGNKLYGSFNGKTELIYTFANGDKFAMPASPYLNIEMIGSGANVVMDEFRLSTCARYTSDYTVPEGQFEADRYTMSLLHFNGNLDSEGNFDNGSSTGEQDFRSGEIHLYTGHDTDLTCGGNKYQHIAIEHGDIEESRGTETATMDLTINYAPRDTVSPTDNRTWFRALKDGIFDGAYLSLDRLYSPIPWRYNMPNIDIDYVLKARFWGRIDVQEVKINSASMQVKSPTDMLTRELPRNLIKPSCQNHFGDFMCQMSPEYWRTDVTAHSGSTRTEIIIGSGYNDWMFDNGMIYCTSGLNAGQHSSIKYFAQGIVHVYKPFYEPVAAGDKFYILRGCDKTMATCRDVYGNLEHFRGFPFLPCKNVLL